MHHFRYFMAGTGSSLRALQGWCAKQCEGFSHISPIFLPLKTLCLAFWHFCQIDSTGCSNNIIIIYTSLFRLSEHYDQRFDNQFQKWSSVLCHHTPLQAGPYWLWVSGSWQCFGKQQNCKYSFDALSWRSPVRYLIKSRFKVPNVILIYWWFATYCTTNGKIKNLKQLW